MYNKDGAVRGVATNDMGISKSGKPKDSYERGMAFHARITLFAEGAHGSLTKTLVKKYNLRKKCDPQTYGIGLKEVWEVPKENWREGEITHSMGYPLDKNTYGGGFMYHFGENLVSLGLVVGLDYKNPYLNPYQEFQVLPPKCRGLIVANETSSTLFISTKGWDMSLLRRSSPQRRRLPVHPQGRLPWRRPNRLHRRLS